jgi:dynein heavy chain, axonemal
VHAKDVVENLWRSNVNETAAFEWISQLRYYWEVNEEEVPGEENCYVKMV